MRQSADAVEGWRGFAVDAGDVPSEGLPEPAGMVGLPNVTDLPAGYRYGVTRYADLIFREALPERNRDLVAVLLDMRGHSVCTMSFCDKQVSDRLLCKGG
jgi:hypothetical protein